MFLARRSLSQPNISNSKMSLEKLGLEYIDLNLVTCFSWDGAVLGVAQGDQREYSGSLTHVLRLVSLKHKKLASSLVCWVFSDRTILAGAPGSTGLCLSAPYSRKDFLMDIWATWVESELGWGKNRVHVAWTMSLLWNQETEMSDLWSRVGAHTRRDGHVRWLPVALVRNSWTSPNLRTFVLWRIPGRKLEKLI